MNSNKVSTATETTQMAQRLPYASPSLKAYGQLRDLTDGGSGALTEGAMMTALTRRP